jgi:hypothetical protein
MNKYCCESFQGRAEASREMGLNIRIVKLPEEFIQSKEDSKYPYKFFITEGYELNSSGIIKRALIHFCPFCGQKLAKHYNSDSFLNETPDNLLKY